MGTAIFASNITSNITTQQMKVAPLVQYDICFWHINYEYEYQEIMNVWFTNQENLGIETVYFEHVMGRMPKCYEEFSAYLEGSEAFANYLRSEEANVRCPRCPECKRPLPFDPSQSPVYRDADDAPAGQPWQFRACCGEVEQIYAATEAEAIRLRNEYAIEALTS